MFYSKILKPILFLLEPEFVHNRIIALGEFLGRFTLTRTLIKKLYFYQHPSLVVTVCGIKFKNPIGLAAGFDKDVRLTQIIPEVGFGFMEIGAVTQFPCAGNPGRRLLRLPEDQSLIVYYGLKNIGSKAVHKKIQNLIFKIPTGINIAKTNRADIKDDKSIQDYVATYRLLAPYFAYSTINISCPNTQDGCSLQDNPELFKKLIMALSREKKVRPVFLKISNSISRARIDQILSLLARHRLVDGFIIANLAKDRSALHLKSTSEILNRLPQGGISGKPIQERSDDLIRYIFKKTHGKYVIIGVGGVFTAEDAYKKIKAGASLVQIITGMIYGGPATVKKINRGLVKLLKKDGYKNIKEAVGMANAVKCFTK